MGDLALLTDMKTPRWKLPKGERNSIDTRIRDLRAIVQVTRYTVATLEEQLRHEKMKLVHCEAALEHLEKDFPND